MSEKHDICRGKVVLVCLLKKENNNVNFCSNAVCSNQTFNSYFILQSRYVKKFKLNDYKFEDFFDGPHPKFEKSVVKKVPRPKDVIDLTEDDLIKQKKKERKEKKEKKARVKKEKDKSKLRALKKKMQNCIVLLKQSLQ